jgi:hypothetical protein
MCLFTLPVFPDDTHAAIVTEGAVGLVIAAMLKHSADAGVCLAGGAALGNLASMTHHQVRIVSEGGIGAIVAAMTGHRKNIAVQSRCARALALVAGDGEWGRDRRLAWN